MLEAVTWRWAAGMGWVIVTLVGTVASLATFGLVLLTLYAFPLFAAVVTFGVCLPMWFAGRIWFNGDAIWALVAGIHSVAAAAVLLRNGASVEVAVVAASPGLLSFLAARDMAKA